MKSDAGSIGRLHLAVALFGLSAMLGRFVDLPAVLVAGVLAWAGLPLSTAFRLPAIVATAAAVLVGILEAGPLLTVLLAAVTLLGACWGMVVLVRALRLSIDHGRRARQVNPADPVQVKRLEDTSRDNATAAGLYALFKHHLAKD